MTSLICKSCGAVINVEKGAAVCECEYCGRLISIQPSIEEGIETLRARADILFLNHEFDRAYSLYQRVVSECVDDSESYWQMVLCTYGITYADDPVKHKKVPTCNKTVFKSVLLDDNYKNAIECADVVTREYYVSTAQYIDDIQGTIRKIVEREESYDVFISYKQTDEYGEPTKESEFAEDLYYKLTEAGYRVFFAPVSLQSKAGSEYEPYIYAALSTAKVMYVIGFSTENIQAVWVKIEWSRFRARRAKNPRLLLIPCYNSLLMDAKDIPAELSARIQARDLINASANDIAEELAGRVKPHLIRKNQFTFNDPLIAQAYEALKNNDKEKAERCLQSVLDYDPDNADAYFVFAMYDLGFRDIKSSVLMFLKVIRDNANIKLFLSSVSKERLDEYCSMLKNAFGENLNAVINEDFDWCGYLLNCAKDGSNVDKDLLLNLYIDFSNIDMNPESADYYSQLFEAYHICQPEISESEKNLLSPDCAPFYIRNAILTNDYVRIDYASKLIPDKLDRKHNLGEKTKKTTLLNYAIKKNNVKAAEILIEAGARADDLSDIFVACDNEDEQMIEMLLSHGADPDVQVVVNYKNGDSDTFYFAEYFILQQKTSLARILLNHNCTITENMISEALSNDDIFEAVIAAMGDVNKMSFEVPFFKGKKQYNSLLGYIVNRYNKSVSDNVRMLISAGADVNRAIYYTNERYFDDDSGGYCYEYKSTPLIYMLKREYDTDDILNIIESGANVNATFNYSEYQFGSQNVDNYIDSYDNVFYDFDVVSIPALNIACSICCKTKAEKYLNVIQFMLDKNAELSNRHISTSGSTTKASLTCLYDAINYAVEYRAQDIGLKIVDILLAHGASWDDEIILGNYRGKLRYYSFGKSLSGKSLFGAELSKRGWRGCEQK